MAENNKISVFLTFLYYKKTLLTCNLCSHEGKKGSDVVSKDGGFNSPQLEYQFNFERLVNEVKMFITADD